jgi:HEAT repeat protein
MNRLPKHQLASVPSRELIAYAVAWLEAPDPGDEQTASTWDAILVLQRRGDRDILEACGALCTSSEHRERRAGAIVLGQLGVTNRGRSRALCSERYAFLTTSLAAERAGAAHPKVLEEMCIALAHLHDPRAIAVVSALSTHPASNVRLAVVHALIGYEDDQAISRLMGLSGDVDASVRDWATFGLGQMVDADTPAIRDALFSRLADRDADTRDEAAMGLARRKDLRVLPSLVDALTSGNFRSLTLDAAAEIANPSLCQALTAAKGQGLNAHGDGGAISFRREWNAAIVACKCPAAD